MNPYWQVFYKALLLILLVIGQRRSMAENWAETVKLPKGEKAVPLFNGRDLSGWEGQTDKYFSVVEGMIRAANDDAVPASTYLFTKENYRNFRLLFEVKQTRSPRHSTIHSAVAALGRADYRGYRSLRISRSTSYVLQRLGSLGCSPSGSGPSPRA